MGHILLNDWNLNLYKKCIKNIIYIYIKLIKFKYLLIK